MERFRNAHGTPDISPERLARLVGQILATLQPREKLFYQYQKRSQSQERGEVSYHMCNENRHDTVSKLLV